MHKTKTDLELFVARANRVKGEQCHKAVLTEAQVRKIRECSGVSEAIAKYAKALGVSRLTIYYAFHRVTWKHVA